MHAWPTFGAFGLADDVGFVPAVAEWIIQHVPATERQRLLIFLPTTRAAVVLRRELACRMRGMLPEILPLQGTPRLAEIFDLDVPQTLEPWALRWALAQVVAELVPEAELPRVLQLSESLGHSVQRLQAQGVTLAQLRHVVGETHVLCRVWQQVQQLLPGLWPAEQEGGLLAAAAAQLAREDCAWRPMVVGVVDGTAGAVQVAQAAAQRGWVTWPVAGARTAAAGAQWAARLGVTPLPTVGRVGPRPHVPLRVAVPDSWHEVYAVSLAVRRAVVAGEHVGVVCSSQAMLQRLSEVLREQGLTVHVSAGEFLATTPLGREYLSRLQQARGMVTTALAWAEWQQHFGTAGRAEWTALLPLLPTMMAAASWAAWANAVLQNCKVETSEAAAQVTLMGPLEARLVTFDTLILTECVEGQWPGNAPDGWLNESALQQLGLPTREARTALTAAVWDTLTLGQPGRVICSFAKQAEDVQLQPSRWLDASWPEETELLPLLPQLLPAAPAPLPLGQWVPGAHWPQRWSATLLTTLMACPYKALAQRVLRVEAQPVVPEVMSHRAAGMLVHAWLKEIGARFGRITEENTAAAHVMVIQAAEAALAEAPPVLAALWRLRLQRLTPALLARWQQDGRLVQAVEQRLQAPCGNVMLEATVDRVERATEGLVVIDFKTGAPPDWREVRAGLQPQLPVEAWLLETLGQERVVGAEYWRLRGWGKTPLDVEDLPADDLRDAVAAVPAAVQNLTTTFNASAPWPATPDEADADDDFAKGHCARCELAGWCRREEQE